MTVQFRKYEMCLESGLKRLCEDTLLMSWHNFIFNTKILGVKHLEFDHLGLNLGWPWPNLFY